MKPWYKRVKILVGLATIAIAILGKFVGPEWTDVVQQVLVVAIAVIAGHTVTDVASMFRKE